MSNVNKTSSILLGIAAAILSLAYMLAPRDPAPLNAYRTREAGRTATASANYKPTAAVTPAAAILSSGTGCLDSSRTEYRVGDKLVTYCAGIGYEIYTVQKGDTIFEIGRKNGIPVYMLPAFARLVLSYNTGLGEHSLQPGYRIAIPTLSTIECSLEDSCN